MFYLSPLGIPGGTYMRISQVHWHTDIDTGSLRFCIHQCLLNQRRARSQSWKTTLVIFFWWGNKNAVNSVMEIKCFIRSSRANSNNIGSFPLELHSTKTLSYHQFYSNHCWQFGKSWSKPYRLKRVNELVYHRCFSVWALQTHPWCRFVFAFSEIGWLCWQAHLSFGLC